MDGQAPFNEKRSAKDCDSAINSLIATCNQNDRFKLLEDDDVLAGDLDNPVHPVFSHIGAHGSMKQALHLASQFVEHDSLLTFFVPLLFGHTLTDASTGDTKAYLSDPLTDATAKQRRIYLKGVREALHCVGHHTQFSWANPGRRVYARTLLSNKKPLRTALRTSHFQSVHSCHVEVSDRLGDFYKQGAYDRATRCAQFRHDFILAISLVHELVHAVGVLRRGDLTEPYIRTDCPDTEWGNCWEHFMFGAIINPQDKTTPGIHLLMRKVWADQNAAVAAGGKEYCDVPMSYIAQWFRNNTWKLIAKKGPSAVSLPETHFRIQSLDKKGAWVISSNKRDMLDDLECLQQKWCKRESRKIDSDRLTSRQIKFRLASKESLQKDNVRAPVRMPRRGPFQKRAGRASHQEVRPPATLLKFPIDSKPLITLGQERPRSSKRKRSVELQDDDEAFRLWIKERVCMPKLNSTSVHPALPLDEPIPA